MRATVIHGAGDIRSETVPDPTIVHPTDAIVRPSVTCICGSDLWYFRGDNATTKPGPIGHEYCGIVEAVGSAVTSVKPGQFVIGSFLASDNSCPHCAAGFQSACVHGEFIGAAQAELLRVPLADGTLVPTGDVPDDAALPSLLTLSDVMGTGWYAAVAAGVQPGMTVAVVGDGAVGLLGVLSAAVMGAERIIAMSRHEPRQDLARRFGATDIVATRGDDAIAAVQELTSGVKADATLECVGTNEAMAQAVGSTRPGGTVGFVGVPHGVNLSGVDLFTSQVGVRGGPAPVRRFLPDLIDRVLGGSIEPGLVFDQSLPLADVAEGYAAMAERRAIKTLLRP